MQVRYNEDSVGGFQKNNRPAKRQGNRDNEKRNKPQRGGKHNGGC